MGMPSRRTNNFPESGRGLGHVTLQFLAVRSAILATAWLIVSIAWEFLFNLGIFRNNIFRLGPLICKQCS